MSVDVKDQEDFSKNGGKAPAEEQSRTKERLSSILYIRSARLSLGMFQCQEAQVFWE
jgi:hypothetical protein